MTDTPSTPTAPSPSGTFKLFERWPQLVATVTGLTAVAGIAYNWAYFSTLGVPGLTQLLSITDQVTSALGWLPGIMLTFLVNYLIGLLAPLSIAASQVYAIQYRRRWILSVYGVLLIVATLFTDSNEYGAVLLALIFFWPLVPSRTLRRVRPRDPSQRGDQGVARLITAVRQIALVPTSRAATFASQLRDSDRATALASRACHSVPDLSAYATKMHVLFTSGRINYHFPEPVSFLSHISRFW
jgi:hypothetical protein